MNFSTAISTCLSKYATFKGRATRSEFWWFYLFTVLLSWGLSVVGVIVLGEDGSLLSSLVTLAFLIPIVAAGSRRLHDIGRSGWWQLLMLTGIGCILLIIWWASDSKSEVNEYGVCAPSTAA
ncbi:DUF805 domain-containing protein [Eoetvoesiella caeni]|uniref:DUF805 domain-containing protein n=1 Tax=Eoetvoesiella caeni TaxID=645616 RepID=UPI000DEBA3C0|nr:DUF805 domain-containing protein [Eoetvoesiella caeni]MCI2808441.1 DUF805 domain-containing protein [Eoetvoesiella caeni]NYT54982.1 DUF805 domain-containing protein [Eoetvoesiella caeni]